MDLEMIIRAGKIAQEIKTLKGDLKAIDSGNYNKSVAKIVQVGLSIKKNSDPSYIFQAPLMDIDLDYVRASIVCRIEDLETELKNIKLGSEDSSPEAPSNDAPLLTPNGIKAGDVVRLKSGSIAMTVECIVEEVIPRLGKTTLMAYLISEYEGKVKSSKVPVISLKK